MDIYHELTSEQVSMGSECEVGSACYSKHDGGEGNCKRKQEMAEKLVHEPDYRTGKNSFEIPF